MGRWGCYPMGMPPVKSRRMIARGFNRRHVGLLGRRYFRGIGNRATLTTAMAGANNDLTFVARNTGTGGNSTTVAINHAAPVFEVQRLSLGSPASGTFTLTLPSSLGGGTTAAINYNATAAAVVAAIHAVAGVPANSVTGSGGPLPGTAVDITFTTLGDKTAFVINGGGLVGGAPTVTEVTKGAGAANVSRSLTVTGSAISLTPATNASGTSTTTANEAADLINRHDAASKLVWAQVAVPGNDGKGAVATMAATNLTGAS